VRPPHFNRRSWRELQEYFDRVARMAARLQSTEPAAKNTTLFATIAARCKQEGKTQRVVVVELVREMRAAKKEGFGAAVESGTCPYCGGYYTIDRTCSGPRRLDDPDANTCRRMRKHARLVRVAIDADITEADERGTT